MGLGGRVWHEVQAPPSLGFSRQEHWSGLPFPSPIHKSESEVTQSNSSRPHGLQPSRLLHPGDFPGKNTGAGCHFLLQKSCAAGQLIFTRIQVGSKKTVALRKCPRGYH